jgi:hypothetical protein
MTMFRRNHGLALLLVVGSVLLFHLAPAHAARPKLFGAKKYESRHNRALVVGKVINIDCLDGSSYLGSNRKDLEEMVRHHPGRPIVTFSHQYKWGLGGGRNEQTATVSTADGKTKRFKTTGSGQVLVNDVIRDLAKSL